MTSTKYTPEQKIKYIQDNLKGVKNEIIRKRAMYLLRCLQSKNITLTSDKFGCSRQKFHFWIKRLEAANFNICALNDLSKAPKNNPNAIDRKIIDKAIYIREKSEEGFGSQKTAFLLERDEGIKINASTLGYIFQRENISRQYKTPKKNKHTKRYSAENPLDRVQSDTKGTDCVDNNGNEIKLYPVIDDCSRAVSVHVANEHSNYEATRAALKFINIFGKPSKWQTDNGTEYTYRFISELNPKRTKEAKISGFEMMLKDNDIEQKLIRPRTPQLNGKIERFNQTMERELEPKFKDGMTLAQIQKIVDDWVHEYNTWRPHYSLKYLTPQERFTGIPYVKKAS
jgi:transposase InsO family protein